MSSLKWNSCLFEQEGTGINYNVFILFSYTVFLCPLVQIPVLMFFNVYLTCSSPTPHWIHPLLSFAGGIFLSTHDHILLWLKWIYYHFYTYFGYCFNTFECLMEVLLFLHVVLGCVASRLTSTLFCCQGKKDIKLNKVYWTLIIYTDWLSSGYVDYQLYSRRKCARKISSIPSCLNWYIAQNTNSRSK